MLSREAHPILLSSPSRLLQSMRPGSQGRMGVDLTFTGFSDRAGVVRQASSPHLFSPNGQNLLVVVGCTKRPLVQCG